jgi:hypothetical protein
MYTAYRVRSADLLGLVQLGPFTLTVSEDGRADLHMPAGATLIVRTAA